MEKKNISLCIRAGESARWRSIRMRIFISLAGGLAFPLDLPFRRNWSHSTSDACMQVCLCVYHFKHACAPNVSVYIRDCGGALTGRLWWEREREKPVVLCVPFSRTSRGCRLYIYYRAHIAQREREKERMSFVFRALHKKKVKNKKKKLSAHCNRARSFLRLPLFPFCCCWCSVCALLFAFIHRHGSIKPRDGAPLPLYSLSVDSKNPSSWQQKKKQQPTQSEIGVCEEWRIWWRMMVSFFFLFFSLTETEIEWRLLFFCCCSLNSFILLL